MKKILGILIPVVLIIGMSVTLTGCVENNDNDYETSVIVDLEDKRSGTDYKDEVTIYKNNQTLGNMKFQESKEFGISPGNYTIIVEGTSVYPERDIKVWKTEITVEEGETVTADEWKSYR